MSVENVVQEKNNLVVRLDGLLSILEENKADILCDQKLRIAISEHPAVQMQREAIEHIRIKSMSEIKGIIT